jgi:hypothetical protein
MYDALYCTVAQSSVTSTKPNNGPFRSAHVRRVRGVPRQIQDQPTKYRSETVETNQFGCIGDERLWLLLSGSTNIAAAGLSVAGRCPLIRGAGCRASIDLRF